MTTDDAPSREFQHAKGAMRLGPSLRRRARVEELGLSGLVDRNVAVAEHDHVRLREPAMQPPGPALGGTAVVNDGHGDAVELQEKGIREHSHEIVIVVPEDGIGLPV